MCRKGVVAPLPPEEGAGAEAVRLIGGLSGVVCIVAIAALGVLLNRGEVWLARVKLAEVSTDDKTVPPGVGARSTTASRLALISFSSSFLALLAGGAVYDAY